MHDEKPQRKKLDRRVYGIHRPSGAAVHCGDGYDSYGAYALPLKKEFSGNRVGTPVEELYETLSAAGFTYNAYYASYDGYVESTNGGEGWIEWPWEPDYPLHGV